MAQELTGQVFRWLTVTGKTERKVSNSPVWECRCRCGNTVYVPGSALLRGNTGCCVQCMDTLAQIRRTKDPVGTSYGKVTVMHATGESRSRSPLYLLQCACGNAFKASLAQITSGRAGGCSVCEAADLKLSSVTHKA